jgi:DNA-binding transcriptional MerR regulator
MRVAELAEHSGVSVRNIRFYHQAGVLPRPRMQGRVGWYGPEHLERLAFVRRLQQRGYSLAVIADTVSAQVPDGLAHPDGVHVTRDELTSMIPELARRPDHVDGAMVRLGLLRATSDGRDDGFEVVEPSLLRAGVALVARGVPLEEALAQLERLREELGAIAERFTLILERDVMPAYSDRGADADETARDLLDELLPAVLVATGSVLREALQEAVTRRLLAGQPSGNGA